MKVLILGGYGVFGGRLAELLSDIASVELIVCGRNLDRATAFCAAFHGLASVRPVQLDRSNIRAALGDERPDLVVDASGPFQDYGDKRYDVVAACIRAGVDYLDFADAADFASGVAQFDAEAKAAGVFVMSGVSSFPALTAAVLRRISEDMDIVSVTGGIAPSPHAGIGLNVMRAVIGYAGGKVKLQRNGVQTSAIGLAETRRHTIAVPGRLPLRNTLFSLVDVPDLQVIPPEHDDLMDIWMGAGPRPEILHRILNLLAKARSRFGLPSLAPFSSVFYSVLNLMRFGEHRGGMFVQERGRRNGEEITRSWHLLAEGDDGPYIPSMAIEAIIRQILGGKRPEPGARPGSQALRLEEFERLFATRSIYTGFRTAPAPGDPLYRQILGEAFEQLPTQVRALHDSTLTRQWVGTAAVRRGKHFLARAIGRLIGFPAAADSVPVRVKLACEPAGERWTRDFGGRTFSSFQRPGTERNQYLLLEQFGIVTVALALVVEDARLYLVPRRWTCLGIPLPTLLLPTGRSFEAEVDGQFRFDVEIAAPLIGLIVAYKGVLAQG